METEIKIVRGPSSTRLTKEAAASELEKLPGFPEGATYSIDDIDGRWVAAVIVPKVAAPFPPGASDGDSDSAGGPPSPDGPPSGEEGPPSDDEGEEPKSEKKEDGEPSSEGAPKEEGKLSIEHQLANLTDMLTKITDALGLSTPADGMVPGPDGGPPGGPNADEGLPPSPKNDNDAVDQQGKQHVVHERSLKPGEAPPGTTPVGAPAFASVADEHPWKDAIESSVKEFEVESPIGDAPLSAVAAELKKLAEPYGYLVTDLMPSGAGETRTASARIVRTR